MAACLQAGRQALGATALHPPAALQLRGPAAARPAPSSHTHRPMPTPKRGCLRLVRGACLSACRVSQRLSGATGRAGSHQLRPGAPRGFGSSTLQHQEQETKEQGRSAHDGLDKQTLHREGPPPSRSGRALRCSRAERPAAPRPAPRAPRAASPPELVKVRRRRRERRLRHRGYALHLEPPLVVLLAPVEHHQLGAHAPQHRRRVDAQL